jgi:ABC-type uncharacterized transport system fused permease/ATPase subunit
MSVDDGLAAQQSPDLQSLKKFLKRFLRILSIGYPRLLTKESLLLLAQLALSVLYAWSYVELSNNAGNLLTAVVSQDRSSFVHWTSWLLFVTFVGSLSNSLILSVGDILTCGRLRSRIVDSITHRYLQNKMFFKLAHLYQGFDDAASRITRSTERFCDKLKLILFGTPMYVGYIPTTATSVYFFFVLWKEAGWFVPVTIVGSFLLFTLISKLMTNRPTKASRELHEQNTQLDLQHTYFSTHSEHIAFLNGQQQEEVRFRQQLQRVADAVWCFALWVLPLNFTTIFFFWMNQVMNVVVPALAWLWLNDTRFTDYTTLANVSSSGYSFLFTMTTYTLLFEEWTALMACTSRIGELLEAMDVIEDDPTYDGTAKLVFTNDNVIQVTGVSMNKPGTTVPLLRDVSFTVKS